MDYLVRVEEIKRAFSQRDEDGKQEKRKTNCKITAIVKVRVNNDSNWGASR